MRGWRSDYEGHWSNDLEATKEFKTLFIGIIYKATWKLKAMKKNTFIQMIPLLCLQAFIHLRIRPKKVHGFWSANRRRIRFLTCCCNTSWTKNLISSFNDCQDTLQNVDDMRSQPFPVKKIFNQRLTNLEIGFVLQPLFLNYNPWINLQGIKSTWN